MSKNEFTVALAGNPNVGKSTVFNALTGMHRHTGNWPGKTVDNGSGAYTEEKENYILYDLPGTYSLSAHSYEEKIARNFICFGEADVTVAVCDACCLERNLNLLLQIAEVTPRIIVCLNLWDEAKKKNIKINTKKLSEILNVPVVTTSANKRRGLKNLTDELSLYRKREHSEKAFKNKYPQIIEEAIEKLEPVIEEKTGDRINSRWVSIKLLQNNTDLLEEITAHTGADFFKMPELMEILSEIRKDFSEKGLDETDISDITSTATVYTAECIYNEVVSTDNKSYGEKDRKIDRLLTSRWFGYPVMFLSLIFIFWLTITGANYPSALLQSGLFFLEGKITLMLEFFKVPQWFISVLMEGVYRVVAWVVSVMLPPMAIFFPLFTVLEDAGFLPRIAFNLDKPLCRCNACGKQSLTMCMGFGCNAAGVIGARIIDSPRERLLAIITNSLVPCNGRFPSIIAVITMFLAGVAGGICSSLLSAFILAAVIVMSVAATFAATKFLSVTFLKGNPSAFTIELPPYRKPEIGRVIVRSVVDRTLFVLGRAVCVAAPAGLILWLAANIRTGGESLLSVFTGFLDPFARLLGLDGVLLSSFVLGLPANEIVLPIALMAYSSEESLIPLENLSVMKEIFAANGWTVTTAVSFILFSVFHWPCSTTLLTVKKETGSLKYTLLAFALPALMGTAVCFIFNLFAEMIKFLF